MIGGKDDAVVGDLLGCVEGMGEQKLRLLQGAGGIRLQDAPGGVPILPAQKQRGETDEQRDGDHPAKQYDGQ